MLDAIVSGAAVFEPHEVATLTAAYAAARRRVADTPAARKTLASIVHNLGRSRLRLKKSMDRAEDVRDLADEAVELYDYLDHQALDEIPGTSPPSADRPVKVFPTFYAAPVRSTFPYAIR